MTVVCLRCENYIERNNHGWPGFCSPECRDLAHIERAARKHSTKDAER